MNSAWQKYNPREVNKSTHLKWCWWHDINKYNRDSKKVGTLLGFFDLGHVKSRMDPLWGEHTTFPDFAAPYLKLLNN